MHRIEALVCAEPGRLQIEQRAAPELAPGQALVRPRRVGVCGTDFHIFQGKHPFLQYPRVIGHELAVEIVAAPDGSGLAAGDICVVNPYISCGDCIACRAGKRNCCVRISVLGVHRDGGMTGLLPVPVENLIPAEGLALDACAAVEFLAIGAHAVKRGAVALGDNVLVVGAGPIGLGAALFARLAGGRVAVFDRDAARAAAAERIAGATAIRAPVDLAAVDLAPADLAPADLARAIDAATGGTGFDVVFDATGNRTAIETGFDFVAHGGRYVLISVIREAITFADPDFHRKEMTLLGSRNATNEDFRRVMQAIQSGAVDIAQLVTHRTSLADAIRDIPLWATQKSGLIKALIEIGD